MNILQVNKLYHPWIGGVETVVKDIAEGLNSKNGLRIDVLVCNSQRKNIIEQTNEIKVFRAHSFGIFLGMPISLDFLCLYRKLEKEYDLIFLHYPFPLGFIAYAFFSNNKNLVIWYHSDIVRQKFLEIFFKPFHFYALKKAKKIFVSSPNLIESSSCLKRLKDKCTVIPFGIDLEKFKFTEEIKNKYDGPLILSVGRFTYYKGFEYLIQSARNINAKFLLIGEGVLQKKYINLIKKYNLENKFFLISPVKNLIPYYYACDVFVLPSIATSEAFGLVLLEAMACGKPLISTELNTGTSFVNQDGITGFVIPPKNSEMLTQKINIILNDKDLRSRFSQNSFERSKEFSKDIFNKRLYEELIKI